MTSTDGPDHRRRLAELMDDRRIELDLSWEEVARKAGMAGMTLRRIRNNQSSLPRKTQRRIDRALEWQPGSVEGILSGSEPVPVVPPQQTEPVDPAAAVLDELHILDEEEYGLELADRLLEARVRLINRHRERTRPSSSDRRDDDRPKTNTIG